MKKKESEDHLSSDSFFLACLLIFQLNTSVKTNTIYYTGIV